jgi:hexokinase
MEECGSIPELKHLDFSPDMPMVINCEYGAFDNKHIVLTRTKYDIYIDEVSPRPGQQAFEKMISGLTLVKSVGSFLSIFTIIGISSLLEIFQISESHAHLTHPSCL